MRARRLGHQKWIGKLEMVGAKAVAKHTYLGSEDSVQFRLDAEFEGVAVVEIGSTAATTFADDQNGSNNGKSNKTAEQILEQYKSARAEHLAALDAMLAEKLKRHPK